MSREIVADPLGRSVAAFVDHLRLERRASSHTVDAYRRDLGQLAEFTRRFCGGAASPRDETKLVLRGLLGALAKERTAASVAPKLSAERPVLHYPVRPGRPSDS